MSEELPKIASEMIPNEKTVPIEIFQGDMLEVDWWSTADIIYTSSICFPDFVSPILNN
jgi:hypothetical protein